MPEMQAPGQETDSGPTELQRTIKLYRAAHELNKPKLMAMRDRSAASADQLAENEHTAAQAQSMRAEANELQMMIDWGDDKFQEWYDADMKLFNKIDVDSNDHLNASEFQKWVEESYQFSADQATAMLKKWDVNSDEAIGKYEFCAIMATLHGEEELVRKEENNKIVMEMMNSLFCCGPTCFIYSLIYGTKCCPFTCGLSCIPFCCQLECMSRQTNYLEENKIEIKAKNAERIKNALSESAFDSLDKGPAASLQTSISEQQTEKTPLLGNLKN